MLPFARSKSVPITLQRERAEAAGPVESVERSRCCLPQLCPHSWARGSLLLGRSWEQLCSLVPPVSPCRCATPRQDVTWRSRDTRCAVATAPASAGTRSHCCCPQLGEGQGQGWDRLSRWQDGSPEPARRSRCSSCWLPACPAAPLSTALQPGQGRAGQGRAGQGKLRERWPGPLH